MSRHLPPIDATLPLRGYYIVAAVAILVASAIPALNSRFLAYGSRSQPSPSLKKSSQSSSSTEKKAIRQSSVTEQFLDHLATYQVPHGYFIHFYVLSVSSSIFWAWQFMSNGFLFTFLVETAPKNGSDPSQTALSWLLMLFQGMRRLYECFAFRTQSKSEIWILQYLFGASFYLITGISCWIEGAREFCAEIRPMHVHGVLMPCSRLYGQFFHFSIIHSRIRRHQTGTHHTLHHRQLYSISCPCRALSHP